MLLPDDLIYEVFCRLAVKPILRCRCVSKHWCSLIDSTTFKKKHLNNAAGALFVTPILGEDFCYSADLDSLDDDSAPLVEIRDPLKHLLTSPDYVGAVNGLACVIRLADDKPVVFLVNPSTRKFLKIPSPPVEFPRDDKLSKHAFGFGYDRANDDFKVVKIAVCEKGFLVTVYSHKLNAWTGVNHNDSDITFSHTYALFGSGSLYWIAKRRSDSATFMVRVDLETQECMLDPFDTSSMPTFDRPACPRAAPGFTSLGGHLFVIHKYDDSVLDLWLMDSSGDKWTWSKVFSLMQAEALGEHWLCRPVAFSRSGEDVLLEATNELHNTRLVWYGIKSKTVKDVEIHGIPFRFRSRVHTESLLQLPEDHLPEEMTRKERKTMKTLFEKLGKPIDGQAS